MSSAAFAVSASASGGVTPSASAFASSLRTRLSRALGGSECIRNLQVDPVELSIELYPRHTTFRRRHAAMRIPAPRHSILGPHGDTLGAAACETGIPTREGRSPRRLGGEDANMAVQISPSVLSADFARLA